MKTPREILLEHHREAEPELDTIRRKVLAQARARGRTPTGWQAKTWATRLWIELVQPCREAWALLAAAWLLILSLNLAPARLSEDARHTPTAPLTSVESMLAEQALMRADLLGLSQSVSPSSDSRHEKPPSGPRSERLRDFNRAGMTGLHACGLASDAKQEGRMSGGQSC